MPQALPFPEGVAEVYFIADLCDDCWAAVAHQPIRTRRDRARPEPLGERGPPLHWEWNIGGKELLEFKFRRERGAIVTVVRRLKEGLTLYAKVAQPTVEPERKKTLATYCPHNNRLVRSDIEV